MKNLRLKSIVKNLAVASLSIVLFFMLLGVSFAKQPGPSFTFPGGKRGQEAINALRERLPEVASRYGKNAEKLKKNLLHDKDLWLDPAENLLYLCSFDISEADALPENTEPAIPTVPLPLDQTFLLHSLPGASKVIYLDFDGHVTSGTVWNNNFNGGADIVSLPYDFNGNTGSFSDAELSRIQKIWARVSEDFAIYNIDVTTEDPGVEALKKNNFNDNQYGIRVVISPSSSWYGNAGGVAYVGSFDWNSDTPTFVFSNKLGNGNEKYVTEATSHESGHTLGLSHDGKTGGTSYYSGHGSWAPIMGVGYYKPITQWSRGEYAGANNTQDDLTVMLTNGASYRPDDHGDWLDSPTVLSGENLIASGIIERTDDMDVFSFQIEAGEVIINAEPADSSPNLDILIQVLDSGGNIIAEGDPYYILPASISVNLPADTYYILVDGVGTGNPDTGYTDYASLGQYFISGTLPFTDILPGAPTDLSASPASPSQINLSWSDNSSNENGFSIERSANGLGGWAEAGFSSADTATFTDTGLAESTTYYYRVAAYNVVGISDYSNTAEATTFDLPPAAPPTITSTPMTEATVDETYHYDPDSTVEATGSGLITFSLGYGPGGMSVNSNGLVTWVPGVSQESVHPVEIVATNDWGTDTQVFEINVAAAPVIGALDFYDFTIDSYGEGQDKIGTVTIENDGTALNLTGNRWQQIAFAYTVTPDTVIEFDFQSTAQGEIHGIGFNDNLYLNDNRTFQLYGTQSWGIQDFNNYTGSGDVQHFRIEVGSFYTGDMQYLFFAMDHDVSNPTGNSVFSNIRVNEDTEGTPPTITSTPITEATVGEAYHYDADSTVEAAGSGLITFALGYEPAGMTVNSNGLVTWVPGVGQEGVHPVEIVATNDWGTDTQVFEINVAAAPVIGALDFYDFTIDSYGEGQDKIGTVTIENDGTALNLTGNRWQQIAFAYTVTPDTVIEFDFQSTAQGEIHGIGFNDNLYLNDNRTFQLYGTQSWGIQDFNNYTGSGDVQHFRIEVGSFYTGDMQYLFFAMDHDVSNPTGNSMFSNIRVNEDTEGTPPTITSTPITEATVGEAYHYDADSTVEAAGSGLITFSLGYGPSGMSVSSNGLVTWMPGTGQEGVHAVEIIATNDWGTNTQVFEINVQPASLNLYDFTLDTYADNQDVTGTVTIESDGATLNLSGNRWQQIALPYTITPDTVLEFDFQSSAQGEIHAIGLDNNLSHSSGYAFQLHGSQNWGIQDFNNYAATGDVQHYLIKVGSFYAGDMQYLFFIMDHDVSNPTGNNVFSNIRVYEDTN